MSEFSTKKLDQLIAALKTNPTAKVGIFGSKNSRTNPDNTNADIGLKHEFGDPTGSPPLPVRSFLRMPIALKMQNYLDASDTFTEATVKEVVAKSSLTPWIKKLGILGEAIVLEAFHTGGFGQWKPSNMTYKKVHQTLVETHQLRDSIASEVSE